MAVKGGNWAAPRDEGQVVVPSDATVFPPPTGALIYVGTTGDVAVMLAGPGNSVLTFKAYPPGTWLPVLVKSVMLTNTTALNMVAVW